jgi:hypothetical protein
VRICSVMRSGIALVFTTHYNWLVVGPLAIMGDDSPGSHFGPRRYHI